MQNLTCQIAWIVLYGEALQHFMILTIPSHINANGVYPFLDALASYRDVPEIQLDFSQLQRVSPAGLAALTAWVTYRHKNRLGTIPINIEVCPILTYLQRMNLPQLCGWSLGDENFQRHQGTCRFLPLSAIGHNVDDLGADFAECIAPGGEDYDHPAAGLYDAAFYLITEMANNVRQHSQGDGFVAAQTTALDGFIRIAIADCGQGITASFRNAGYLWAQDTSDRICINKALDARISSKGQPSNEGVGLTLSARVANLMGGHILISSGTGGVIAKSDGSRQDQSNLSGSGFPGTLITMAFLKPAASEFNEKLLQAKDTEGLLQGGNLSGMFRP